MGMTDEQRKDIANAMSEQIAERHTQAVKEAMARNGEVNKKTGEVLQVSPLLDFDKLLNGLDIEPKEKQDLSFDDDEPVNPDEFLQAAELPPVAGVQGQGEAVAPASS